MSVPTFALSDTADLLGDALVRMNDAIAILEFESDDAAARAKALRLLKAGVA